MQFTLITPTRSQVYILNWIEVQTSIGSFVIQLGHVPTIVTLTPGKEITLGLEDGTTVSLPVEGGILEVDRNQATLIITHE